MLSSALTFALAFSTACLVQADVIPTGPTPGDIFREGGNCLIQYTPDQTGNAAWKNLTIDLMSGSNFNMTTVVNVATGIDGSQGGVINWDCPDVTPNSQIYFYQYTATGQNVSWTGRFTIAGSGGETTQPTESEAGVQFGFGALTNPNEAVAKPEISGGAAGGANATSSASSALSSSSATSAMSTMTSAESSSSSAAGSSSSSSSSASSSAAVSAPAQSQSATPAPTSGAVKLSAVSVSALIVAGLVTLL